MKEKLLIDIIEETVDELREKTAKLRKLNRKFREYYDRDLKREMNLLMKDIRKIKSAFEDKLYVHMDEFRNIKKYYPVLLDVYLDDPYIGQTIKSKMWLLEFRDLPEAEAQYSLRKIKEKRDELRNARKELSKRGRLRINEDFLEDFPFLADDLSPGMLREEALDVIEEQNRKLKREGWLVLISSCFIGNVANAMCQRLEKAKQMVKKCKEMEEESEGRGTIAESNAKRKLDKVKKKKNSLSRKLAHLLQSNPAFLRSLKKGGGFKRVSFLQSFAKEINQKSVREKPWLEKMKERLS